MAKSGTGGFRIGDGATAVPRKGSGKLEFLTWGLWDGTVKFAEVGVRNLQQGIDCEPADAKPDADVNKFDREILAAIGHVDVDAAAVRAVDKVGDEDSALRSRGMYGPRIVSMAYHIDADGSVVASGTHDADVGSGSADSGSEEGGGGASGLAGSGSADGSQGGSAGSNDPGSTSGSNDGP